jgi:hypothetical protein
MNLITGKYSKEYMKKKKLYKQMMDGYSSTSSSSSASSLPSPLSSSSSSASSLPSPLSSSPQSSSFNEPTIKIKTRESRYDDELLKNKTISEIFGRDLNSEEIERELEANIDESLNNNSGKNIQLKNDRIIITKLIKFYSGTNENLNKKIKYLINKKQNGFYDDELILLHQYKLLTNFDNIEYFLRIFFEVFVINIGGNLIELIYSFIDNKNKFADLLLEYTNYNVKNETLRLFLHDNLYTLIKHIYKNNLCVNVYDDLNLHMYCRFIYITAKNYDIETINKMFKYFDRRELINIESDPSIDLMNADENSESFFHKLAINFFLKKYDLIKCCMETKNMNENNLKNFVIFIKGVLDANLLLIVYQNDVELDIFLPFIFTKYKIDPNIFDSESFDVYLKLGLYKTLIYLANNIKLSDDNFVNFIRFFNNKFAKRYKKEESNEVTDEILEKFFGTITITTFHLELVCKYKPCLLNQLLNHKIQPSSNCFTNLIDNIKCIIYKKHKHYGYIDQLISFGYKITHEDIIYATQNQIKLNDSVYTKNFVPDETFYKFCNYDFMPVYNDNMYNDDKWVKRAKEIINDNKVLIKYDKFITSLIKIDNKVAKTDLCIELEMCRENYEYEKNLDREYFNKILKNTE